MVSDEERDYMYAEYAKDPRMKANIGIRRRLAPLLDNDRNQLELFTALLLSLPGSPVLYYGDEIGMGDNIWLGDRDGVRTPDAVDARTATPASPPPTRGGSTCRSIMDPIYGYQAVNVEAQQRNSTTSLLHWTRRMIEIRKRHHAFGLGEYTRAGRHATRRCWRTCASHGDDVVLCVNNMSRFPQPVELDLSAWRGRHARSSSPAACTFPPIGELPYLLTLAGPRLLLVLHHARGTGPEAVRSRPTRSDPTG